MINCYALMLSNCMSFIYFYFCNCPFVTYLLIYSSNHVLTINKENHKCFLAFAAKLSMLHDILIEKFKTSLKCFHLR